MKIKKIKINNILSIEHLELEFGNSGIVLLDGWNSDDSTSNGAGKTSIFNAMSFGLYGKMPRDITASDYLRKGTKSGSVKVTLDCSGDTWTVTRSRPNGLVFTKNGNLENIAQVEFETTIKLNYSQFLLTMYASQLKTEKFLLLNDSGKKDFLLQIMDLDKFSSIRQAVSDKIKTLQKNIIQVDQEFVSLKSKIHTLKESFIDPTVLQQQYLQLSDTQAIDGELSAIGTPSEPDMAQFQQVLDKINKKKQVFDEIKIEINTLRRSHTQTLSQKKSKKNVVTHLCPHCKDKVIVTNSGLIDANDIVAQNNAIDLENATIVEQASNIMDEISALEDKLAASKQLVELEQKVREKHSANMYEYQKTVQHIKDLQALRKSKLQEANFINEKLKNIEQIEQKIVAANLELESITTKRAELRSEQTILETIGLVVSPSGAPAYISDLVIDRLNEAIATYIEQIWTNASYSLLPYKENKNGEVRSKFSEKIVIAGKERSLGSLSGGELRCLSLAVDLAIVDVVTDMLGIAISPIILDEAFDGMDNANRERAILMLSKVATDKEIWVIDHNSEARSMFSKVVKVEKHNEITRLIED